MGIILSTGIRTAPGKLVKNQNRKGKKNLFWNLQMLSCSRFIVNMWRLEEKGGARTGELEREENYKMFWGVNQVSLHSNNHSKSFLKIQSLRIQNVYTSWSIHGKLFNYLWDLILYKFSCVAPHPSLHSLWLEFMIFYFHYKSTKLSYPSGILWVLIWIVKLRTFLSVVILLSITVLELYVFQNFQPAHISVQSKTINQSHELSCLPIFSKKRMFIDEETECSKMSLVEAVTIFPPNYGFIKLWIFYFTSKVFHRCLESWFQFLHEMEINMSKT